MPFRVDKVQISERLSYLKPLKSELDTVKSIPLLRIYAVYPPDKKTGKVWFDGMGKVVTDLEIKYIIPMGYKSGLIMISYTDQKLAEYWNKFINQGPEKLEQELLRQLKLLFPKKILPRAAAISLSETSNSLAQDDKISVISSNSPFSMVSAIFSVKLAIRFWFTTFLDGKAISFILFLELLD